MGNSFQALSKGSVDTPQNIRQCSEVEVLPSGPDFDLGPRQHRTRQLSSCKRHEAAEKHRALCN